MATKAIAKTADSHDGEVRDASLGSSASPRDWPALGLLAVRDLTLADVREALHRAARYDAALRSSAGPTSIEPALTNKVIANLFLEDSTRTRVSFSIAAMRLGGRVVDVTRAGSSASKGETLLDTARNIDAIGADAIVVRCAQAGAAKQIARCVSAPVLNAGDGAHAHPTQGLLDVLTIAEAHSRLDGFDLSGLRVVYVGDALHSRVVRSGVAALTSLGATVTLVGPPALAPDVLTSLGASVSHDLDSALAGAHAVVALRMQKERHGGASSADALDLAAYRRDYQLTASRMTLLDPTGVALHPGPMNRGLEIASVVADGPRSRIFRQPAIGVAVRMAVLALCTGK